MLGHILLFLSGLLQDALSALYLRMVKEDKIKWAVFLSVLITALSCGAWAAIISSSLDKDPFAIISYSLGGGLGTYLGLKKNFSLKGNVLVKQTRSRS